MAYVPQYTANFTNELMQEVNVTIAKKDGASVTPANYKVVSLRISDNSDDQDIYACIISKELELVLWTEAADAITWETFITSAHDDWKVTVEIDNQIFFVGFIAPENGNGPFQDKPYELVLKANDGLGLLKGIEISDTSNNKFANFNKPIEYIAGILKKTNLDLNIKTYCSICHKDLPSKSDDLTNDFFNLVRISARTFNKSITEYESCYDALKILLSGWCNIQQYNGQWQITVLAERQYAPYGNYFVLYDSAGTAINAGSEIEPVGLVGKNELIYPINESQSISSNYAYREVKTNFNYEYPQECVVNQTLQLKGAEIPALSGSGYKAYQLVGWDKMQGDLTNLQSYAGTKNMYIRSDFDGYGVEVARYFKGETDNVAGTLKNHFMNSNVDFFVDKNDKFIATISFRSENNVYVTTNSPSIVQIALLVSYPDGSIGTNTTLTNGWYTLDKSGVWTRDITKYISSGWWNDKNSFDKVYEERDDQYFLSLTTPETVIPASGQIFIRIASNSSYDVKPVEINFTTELRRSNYTLKGDYHLNKNNNSFPDRYENTTKISESPKRFARGSFIRSVFNNEVKFKREYWLLPPAFYRFPNTSETKNFKQLANYGKFNHTYRRFYKIEGDFTSIMYNTASDQNLRKPLGFHKRYRFTDMNPVREFVLEPSLEMDLVTGNIKATFVEVYKDSNDGQSTGDVDKFDYIF